MMPFNWRLGIAGMVVLVLILFSAVYLTRGHACNQPYITLTFDDGYQDHYQNAFPILKKYNVPAAVFIMPSRVGDFFEKEKLMIWDQLHELQENGWEIGSHTLTHRDLTQLTEAQLREEIVSSKARLEERGFSVKTFAFPYGKENVRVSKTAEEYYPYIRPSVWGLNNLSNLDPHRLNIQWAINTTSLTEMQSWVDEAEEKNLWLIFNFHLVRDDIQKEYTLTPENLDKLIAYIKQRKIRVKTIQEVMELSC